ncbi:MAG: hypothetical protein U9N59_10340 [Campylobacterota bacterium]|nr:hypothetical protein [Campylobacterota bacterium]
MKKTYSIITATILSIGLIGCGSSDDNGGTTTPPASGFTKTTNTFTINDSNVTWQDNSDIYTLGADSKADASQVCTNKTIDGFSDWRLPTKLETFTLYSTNRANLDYTYEHYKVENYFDTTKLRHLTWTDYELDNRDAGGNLMYGVMNEISATESGEDQHSVMFLPADGHQSGQTYSIRCIRNITEQNDSNTQEDTTTITFKNIGYNEIISQKTGKTWLDRNLGATSLCSNENDTNCFGDYYQWGRLADGHQLKTSSTTTTKITTTEVSSDYILGNGDWSNTDSDGSSRLILWNKTNGEGICPINFRVPTLQEWIDEVGSFQNKSEAFSSFLKIPFAGKRSETNGDINAGGINIWTTNRDNTNSMLWRSTEYMSDWSAYYRTGGVPVRCIKD